jgi:hypothetical protein
MFEIFNLQNEKYNTHIKKEQTHILDLILNKLKWYPMYMVHYPSTGYHL